MRDVLEELKEVHKQQRATVLGHWTEECIGRAVAEIERLRSFRQAVLDPENQPSQYGTTLTDAVGR